MLSILRLGRWRRQLAQKTRRAAFTEVASEIILPIALLVGPPALLQLPFDEFLRATPDLGYWMLVSAIAGVATAMAKAFMASNHYDQEAKPLSA
ncbi:MAG: hypothetical protein H7Y32_07705 [Chloroflexales bacterium]|nr:hypothetical protein [Chloroflexales bacterium]